MAYSHFFYLVLGFLGSFIGTIPFGPINLSVVDTTLKDGMRAAMVFALAAAIIEFIYSYISLSCYWTLNAQIESNKWVPIIVAIIFLLGGLYFFFKKGRGSKEVEEPPKRSNFIKGLIISVLNPQAVPYWIFVISFYQMRDYISMSTTQNLQIILFFVSGAFIGKIACLAAFAYLSKIIAHRISRISLLMDKIIGVVLFIIGISQFVKIL